MFDTITNFAGNSRTAPQLQGAGRLVAALCVGAALVFAMAGCSSGGDNSGTASTGTTGGTSAASTGGVGVPSTGGAMMSGSGGMPGMGSGAMMGMSGMGGQGGGEAIAATKPPSTTPAPNHRVDPFKPWWSTTPPAPNPLTMLEPVRIAVANTAAETKAPGVEIQEVPNRRVAGILTGNGVYALIEDAGGEGKVVKPGDPIDGYRVAAINADSVVLKRTIDNRTYTQVVPLTDAGSTTQFSGPPAGGAGGPGMMMPGRPGMGIPGMPGRKGGGGGAAASE